MVAVTEYTTPTAVRLAPPVEVTLPPRVALVIPTLALVGLVTVGVVAGVTAEEAGEALLVPTLFVAVTVKGWLVPLVKPVTTWRTRVRPAFRPCSS